MHEVLAQDCSTRLECVCSPCVHLHAYLHILPFFLPATPWSSVTASTTTILTICLFCLEMLCTQPDPKLSGFRTQLQDPLGLDRT